MKLTITPPRRRFEDPRSAINQQHRLCGATSADLIRPGTANERFAVHQLGSRWWKVPATCCCLAQTGGTSVCVLRGKLYNRLRRPGRPVLVRCSPFVDRVKTHELVEIRQDQRGRWRLSLLTTCTRSEIRCT